VRPEATYNFVEAFQVRDRWIFPDVGYIDFSDTRKYREWFVGGGYKPLVTKHVTIAEEVYFVQAERVVSAKKKRFDTLIGSHLFSLQKFSILFLESF